MSKRTLLLSTTSLIVVTLLLLVGFSYTFLQSEGQKPLVDRPGRFVLPGEVKRPSVVRSSPYGFTVLDNFTPRTVALLKQLGVRWIRYQRNWYDIEPQPGRFHWERLDSVVALANSSGIHISFPIQGAPEWARMQVCAGVHFLPGVNEITQFASAVAQRYNGKHGHGYIDSYEVGNEEYDIMLVGNMAENLAESIPCRQPTFYGPSLKSVYKSIKAVSPEALVGMFGLWWSNTPHIYSFMEWLYQHGYGDYFDFANYHYYICNGNPAVAAGDRPSFDGEWQVMHDVMAKYHDAYKPIWVTEIGWNVSGVDQKPFCTVTPQVQANYMSYVLKEAKHSHVIERIFWYTIDRGNDGMSITQTQGVLPSFYVFQAFVRLNPQWD